MANIVTQISIHTDISGALSQINSGGSLDVPNIILSPPFNSCSDDVGDSACN